jgi:A/G-specific adenine glycosylase
VSDSEFQEMIWQKSRELYRDMPWRADTRGYYVLVSELMLQQTQVARVIPKFNTFITTFPDERSLAKAGLADVLKLWQGLGYNRRAKYLHESAKQIVRRGTFPRDNNELLDLPGVGKNTAGAILAYAYNQPAIFVETNIRTVYLHHFFTDDVDVTDDEIIMKLEETIDNEHPREFYWALMDYGSWLKASGVRNNSQSKIYKRQSLLKGSLREVRGMILRELSMADMSFDALQSRMPNDERFQKALDDLSREKMVFVSNKIIHLTK